MFVGGARPCDVDICLTGMVLVGSFAVLRATPSERRFIALEPMDGREDRGARHAAPPVHPLASGRALELLLSRTLSSSLTLPIVSSSRARASIIRLQFSIDGDRPFSSYLPQHFLYFFPLPHGQGSFLPTRGLSASGAACSSASSSSSSTPS